MVLALLAVSGCDRADELPVASELSAPKSGDITRLRSGVTVSVQQVSDTGALSVSETAAGSGSLSPVVSISLTGTRAVATLRVSIPQTESGTAGILQIRSTERPGVDFYSLGEAATSQVWRENTGPTDVSLRVAPGVVRTVEVEIRSRTTVQVNVVPPVPPAANTAACPNVYRITQARTSTSATAPVVVLLHGWQYLRYCSPADTRRPLILRMVDYDPDASWQPMVARIAAEYPDARVLVPRYATEFDPQLNAGWLLEALQADQRITGSTRVVLVGHSMGGLVARALAARWSELTSKPKLAGIVTLGTPHLGTNAASSGLRSVLNSSVSPISDPGLRSLRPRDFDARVPWDGSTNLHTIAGQVGCSQTEEARVGAFLGVLLDGLCRDENRVYRRIDPATGLEVFTSYSAVSDAVVPLTSALFAGGNVTSRETLPGSIAHMELTSSPAAIGAVSQVLKPYLQPVARATIVRPAVTPRVGDQVSLVVDLRAADNAILRERQMQWSSSVPSVATVNADGLLDAKSQGTTVVQVTVEGVTASLAVTVSGTAPVVDCSATPFPPASARPIAPTGGQYSGGPGQFLLAWNLGTRAQNIVVNWDMLSAPDGLTICFRGTRLFRTAGLVSGASSFSFAYPGAPGNDASNASQSIYLFLAVDAPLAGTGWNVRVNGTYVPPTYAVPISFRSVANRSATEGDVSP